MRSSLRFWLALSLLLVAGAIIVWLKGRTEKSSAPVAWSQPQSAAVQMPALLTTPSVLAATGAQAQKPESASAQRARYQLKNVDQPIEALTRVDSAILMRNALIDTRQPVDLPIPADLRAGENPGAYIVQADRAPTAEFQNALKAAGADIVAYVPNNAFLVKAGHEVAANLQNQSGVRSVLPYEPYYKLDTRLMKFAVDHETMADDAWLRVTLFPGVSTASIAALANSVGPKEKSPFGEQILIQPRAGVLADLAQLAEVQIIEPVNPRVVANDLSRVALGVSTDTLTNANHLGLSGKDVWVNVNDIGVQSNHTSLAGRVFYNRGDASADFEGHGTHVAGHIAGGHATKIFDHLDRIGTNSLRTNIVMVTDDDGNTTTNLFVDGSRTNADFRGIAHEAKLFVLGIDADPDVNQPVTDTYLIETAARTNYFTLKRTNETLISNNSWNYANTPDYDSQAARFDAATRDALQDDTGSQPVLYVFAAGNIGFGGEDGLGGEPGTISSPGTAKNVITVGALEQPRFISESLTNVEEQTQIDDDGTTNTIKITNLVAIFRPITDSGNEVASFSSRGNVGIGVEGALGRFKPDLVAPGTFVWSARSTNWNLTNDFDPLASSNIFNVLSNLNGISSEYRYDSGTSISAGGVSGMLALVQEFFSHKLPPDRRRNLSPALMKALLINSSRSVNALYDWSPQPEANYQGWGLVDLRNLLTTTDVEPPLTPQATLEAQAEKDWPLQLIEQSPTNAVATGEERVWNIRVDTNAMALPLRFTLVWTDPPGNPQVGVKLVNDLDLTVEAGGRVFHGNDFPPGLLVTEGREPRPAGELPIDDPYRDSINNVEKIVIGNPMSLRGADGQPATNFVVRVSGRRVNVKAVNDYYDATGRTNEIVQDFALVFSSDNPFVPTTFPKIERVDPVTVKTNFFVQPVFNGVEATNQRAGANSPLYWTNGNAVQWRFYVFTNSPNTNGLLTNVGRYVAFITAAPLNVGKPRNIEPDVDIYVSKKSQLTNLEQTVVSTAWKSTTRLGTEQVVFAPDIFVRDSNGNLTFGTNEDGSTFTNTVQVYDPAHPELGGVVVNQANIGDVFYIGVKSEDQQAGEFSFIAISSQNPFEEDRNGIRIIHMLPAPTEIPDGAPNLPQGRRYYGIPLRGGKILDASTYFYVQHEELGDLVGTVGHGARYATLNNHSLPNGFTDPLALVYSSNPYVPVDATGHYDDINEYPPGEYIPGFPAPGKPLLFRPDGPIDLSTYVGASAAPVWTLDMVDNAASHVGSVSQAEIHVKPLHRPLLNGETITDTVNGHSQNFYPVDLPNDATKLTIKLKLIAPPVANTNILLLVSKDVIPSTNRFDYMATFTAGGSDTITLSFDRNSQPPLIPGEYIIGIINTGDSAVKFELTILFDEDATADIEQVIGGSNIQMPDDARTNIVREFTRDRVVVDASVKLLTRQERTSDIIFRLTSPQGTSVILSENRGWFDSSGFGVPGPDFRNGGFEEDLTVPKNGAVAAVPAGWNGSGITIINGNFSAGYPLAHEGQQYVRLDDSSTLAQAVTITSARKYFLRWVDSSQFNGLGQTALYSVAVTDPGGAVISTNIFDASAEGLGFWTERELVLDLAVGSYTVTFRGLMTGQAKKPLIDGVSLSGSSYVLFTDEPERAIKFAPLPYGDTSPLRGLAFSNSFEAAVPGTYNAGNTFDGWTVESNSASVNLGGAPDGNQYLRTGLGSVSRTLPTSRGRAYRLSLLFRAPPPLGTNVVSAASLVTLAGIQTNSLSLATTNDWQKVFTEFVADKTNMVLRFSQIPTSPGLDIDLIQLEDTGTIFVSPEEPLAILEGERAMGDWKLEAIDNRTGAVNPSVILDWQLILDTANPARFAEPLASGQFYPSVIHNPIIRTNMNVYTPGKILGGETEWFYFDVCNSATEATIELFGPKTNTIALELLVDRSGFPTGDPETDDYAIVRTTPGKDSTVTLPLSLTQPISAPLQAGKRIFIAVRGAQFPLTTNETFLVRVQPNGCGFRTPQILSAGESVSSVADPTGPDDDGATYQTSTTGASSVSFAADGTLTLLASNGVEPTENNYQIRQTVTSGSIQVALPTAGTWYFRVVNEGSQPVQYSLSVEGQPTSAIRAVRIENDHLTVTWQSSPGVSYEIATSTDLVNWTPVTTVQANSTETSYTDTETTSDGAKFIRIRQL